MRIKVEGQTFSYTAEKDEWYHFYLIEAESILWIVSCGSEFKNCHHKACSIYRWLGVLNHTLHKLKGVRLNREPKFPVLHASCMHRHQEPPWSLPPSIYNLSLNLFLQKKFKNNNIWLQLFSRTKTYINIYQNRSLL